MANNLEDNSLKKPLPDANAAVPKGILTKPQRKSDVRHKPFRSSPLSSTAPSLEIDEMDDRDPLNSSDDVPENTDKEYEPEEPKSTKSTDRERKPEATRATTYEIPQKTDGRQHGDTSDEESLRTLSQNSQSNVVNMRLSSEESEDERNRNKSESEEGPDDEIARLFKRVDIRMAEILGVEKRLDDIEKKAIRLFDVIAGQLKKGFVDQIQEMSTIRTDVVHHLEQMDRLLKRTIEARDRAIEQHTRDMVERHVNEVEGILQHIEELARELEKRQPSKCARLVRSILWGVRVLLLTTLVLTVLVYILLDDDETYRIFSWILDGTWTTVAYFLIQKEVQQRPA